MYFSVLKTSKNKDKFNMNEKFENQKEKLISIKQEISLLYQQVNYLIRNEKPLELLDLDVLMNRTHSLCSVSLGDEAVDEDLPFDAEAFSGLFGSLMQDDAEAEPEAEMEPEEELEPEEEVEAPLEETPVEEEQPAENLEEMADEEEQPIEEEMPVEVELPVEQEPLPMQQEVEEETPEEERPLGDEYGFFFRFEDIPEREEAPEVPEETPAPVDNGNKVVHVMEEIPEEEIPERDRVHGDDLVKDNPLEMPEVEDEPVDNEQFGFEKPVANSMSNFFDNDDSDFELSTPETLGDKLMQEDHSLAAKLQQNPQQDLKSAIGINDKFLFVNELFGGSMEKYNKSIENLNDLKTLNGAMIYLNELKIELQWNSSNEAYQKLRDLVAKKFD